MSFQQLYRGLILLAGFATIASAAQIKGILLDKSVLLPGGDSTGSLAHGWREG